MRIAIFFLMANASLSAHSAASSLAIFSNALDLVDLSLMPAEDPLVFMNELYHYVFSVGYQRIAANGSLEAPVDYKNELSEYLRRLIKAKTLLDQNPSLINRSNAYECMQLLAAVQKLAAILLARLQFKGKNLHDIWLTPEEKEAFVSLYKSTLFQETLPNLQRSLAIELNMRPESSVEIVIEWLKSNKLKADSAALQARLDALLAERARLDRA